MKGFTALCLSFIMITVSAYADSQQLTVGQPVPEVVLTTTDVKPFNLREAALQQPIVLIFYRGGWCPYCNRHLSAVQHIEPKLREMGFRILAVSPDRPEKLKATIDKESLSCTLLSDSSMTAAKAFGLAFTVDDSTLKKYAGYGIDLEDASGQSHHMLPVPAVFLLGTDGVIDYAHSNPDYKKRLSADDLLDAAKIAVAGD